MLEIFARGINRVKNNIPREVWRPALGTATLKFMDESVENVSRKPTFLRQWRKFRKLSQEKATDRLGIKQGTISKIESGKLPYNQDLLEKAALAYGCEVVDLLTVDPTRPRETDVIKLFRLASPEVKRIVETILKTGTGG